MFSVEVAHNAGANVSSHSETIFVLDLAEAIEEYKRLLLEQK